VHKFVGNSLAKRLRRTDLLESMEVEGNYRDYKSPKPITSDESNSTEHDVTVSLSGTDDNNDGNTVFSDSISLASKVSKVHDTKRSLHKMAKLKEENMLLKEALEKANASDITMLNSKLRGAHADLVRLRQNNMELKDRIQVLEGRLFSALSSQTPSTGSSGTPSTSTEPDAIEQRTIQPTDSKFTSSERVHLMDIIKSLQSRCKHLSRLTQSYESKIAQLESDRVKELSEQTEQPLHSTVAFNVVEDDGPARMDGNSAALSDQPLSLKSVLKGSAGATYSSAADKKPRQVRLRQDATESRVVEARAEDAKMIRELSAEVKRLAALVPRAVIEATEQSPEQSAASGEQETEQKPHDTIAAEEANVESVNKFVLERSPAAVGYSAGQLLTSFLAGVVVMLLCVALSGSTLYARGTKGAS
jgi:hypothetical protein